MRVFTYFETRLTDCAARSDWGLSSKEGLQTAVRLETTVAVGHAGRSAPSRLLHRMFRIPRVAHHPLAIDILGFGLDKRGLALVCQLQGLTSARYTGQLHEREQLHIGQHHLARPVLSYGLFGAHPKGFCDLALIVNSMLVCRGRRHEKPGVEAALAHAGHERADPS